MNASVSDTETEMSLFNSFLPSSNCFNWVHLVNTWTETPTFLLQGHIYALPSPVCSGSAPDESKSLIHQTGFASQSTFIISCTASLSGQIESRLFLLPVMKVDSTFHTHRIVWLVILMLHMCSAMSGCVWGTLLFRSAATLLCRVIWVAQIN